MPLPLAAMAVSIGKQAAIGAALSGVKEFTGGNFRKYEGSSALMGVAAQPQQMGYSFNNPAWSRGRGARVGDVLNAAGKWSPQSGGPSGTSGGSSGAPHAAWSAGRGFRPANPIPSGPGLASGASARINWPRTAINATSREVGSGAARGALTAGIKALLPG